MSDAEMALGCIEIAMLMSALAAGVGIQMAKKCEKDEAKKVQLGEIHLGHVDRDEGLYIGRGSIFGNPYKIADTTSREHAIDLYRLYLTEAMTAPWYPAQCKLRDGINGLVTRVRRGEMIVLVCHCEPADCHGDVIIETVRRLASE